MLLKSKPTLMYGTDGAMLMIPLQSKFLNDIQEQIEKLNIEKEVEISIKNLRKKRSLEANGYLWVLCEKIAQKINSTKTEVYQKAIREVGVCDVVLVRDEAVDETINRWSNGSLGNFAEVAYKSKKVPGCTALIIYFGSHSYDTKEMSRLIDYIVEEAKGLGIETLTPDELERLKGAWK